MTRLRTHRTPKIERQHVDPGLLQRMADGFMSRAEIARVLKLTEGTLARRLKRHSVTTKGEEVRREREWLHEGRHVIREPYGEGLWVWTDPARNWSGPKMRPAYLEAMLEHGFLQRVETVGNVSTEHFGNVSTEHYRHVAVGKDQDGDR